MGLFRNLSSRPTPAARAQVLFEVWGQRGWQNFDIVGESHYAREIRALFPARLNSDGQELIIPVTITHDVGNPHDRNAVEVRASTGVLGYLAREEAARYAPALDRIQALGLTPATTARVWGHTGYFDSDDKQFVGSVRLDLPAPHMLMPTNRPPSATHVLLPVGAAVQVTGEEKHMSAIGPFLCPAGECWVYATLHEIVEKSARTSKTLAEVRIDGEPVGRLTPKMSTDMLPAVDYLAQHGRSTAVRATVKGNALKAEVVLYTKRSSELHAEWFDQINVPETSGVGSAARPSVDPEPIDVRDPNSVGGKQADPPSATGRSEPPPPLPPANWYPDPQNRANLRYWDGASWTVHTAPAARS
jgi:hypothetical protein